jgi:hypothetical protein
MSIHSTRPSRDERVADGGPRPLTITVKMACKMSGLGATKIWELLKDGRLKAVRIDRRTLVLVHSLEQLLALDSASQPAPLRRGRPRKGNLRTEAAP